jgi:hypothetical protein
MKKKLARAIGTKKFEQADLRRNIQMEENVGKSVHTGLTPEELFETNERQKRLMAAMRALPEQSRCCLSLRAEGVALPGNRRGSRYVPGGGGELSGTVARTDGARRRTVKR